MIAFKLLLAISFYALSFFVIIRCCCLYAKQLLFSSGNFRSSVRSILIGELTEIVQFEIARFFRLIIIRQD